MRSWGLGGLRWVVWPPGERLQLGCTGHVAVCRVCGDCGHHKWAVVLRLFFGDWGSRRNMVPNSVSYRRAKPFKVLAAAPRPREKGRIE